jgi:DUF1365 family protein
VSSSEIRHSALLTGTVMHRRLLPFPHAFEYGLAMYRLDLDELDAIDRQLRLFGVDRARPVSFRRADHLPDVRALVREHGVQEPIARVELVTSCRVFGYVFNPVSFFFCYAGDARLVAIACEVHNTFGQSHAYVLTEPAAPGQWREKKVFHVSPFFTMDGTYRFRFTVSEERIEAGIDLYRRAVRVAHAAVAAPAAGPRTARVPGSIPPGHAEGDSRHPLGGAPPLVEGRGVPSEARVRP